MPLATLSRSPSPRSARSSERKYDWKRRSPSSSCSLAVSSASAASATSYASSTVCGTIVRSVCSRSHGHSRRSRSVSSWSSTSASARDTPPRLAGGGRGRRRGARDRRAEIRARLVAGGVVDRLRLAVRLLEIRDPVVHEGVLLRARERVLDLRLLGGGRRL